MKLFGTDVMSVACIVGGGVVAGGITLALAHGPGHDVSLHNLSFECATTVSSDAKVVMSLGDEGLVFVTPNVRLHGVKECMDGAAVVEVNMDRAQERAEPRVERARREADRARQEVDRVRHEVDRVRERVERIRRVGERERQREVSRIRVRRSETIDHEWVEQLREALTRHTLIRQIDDLDLEQLGEQLELQLEGLSLNSQNHRFEFRFRDLEGVDFDFGSGDFDFDFDFDFDLDFDFDDLDFDDYASQELDEARHTLQMLERQLEELRLDGGDKELQSEILRRLEEAERQLQERLERVGDGDGR